MKTYGYYGKDHEDIGYSVLQTEDGGYITCGLYNRDRNSSSHNLGNIFIVRTDENGDTLWTKTYGDSSIFELGTAIFNSDDGGYFVFYNREYSYYLSLMKISSKGDSLWTKHYNEYRNHPWAKNIKQSRDKKFFLVAANSSTNDLLRLDSEGNIIEIKTFAPGINGYFLGSVDFTSDGGYVISHSRNSPENQSNYVCLTKLDDSLNIQWEKNYPPPTLTEFESSSDGTGYDVIQTSDDGYLSLGTNNRAECYACGSVTRGWIIKTDFNGDTLWTRLLALETYLYSGFESSDGSYIACGEKNTNSVYIIKLDTQGNTIWERSIRIPDYKFRGFDIKETKDGGYITTGQSRYGSSGDPDLFLIKVNKEGMLVSVKDNEVTIPTLIYLEQNYPNPFNPTTTINYTIPKGGNVRLEIYNSLGEIVNILKDSYEDAGAHTITWNGNDSNGNSLSSGIYFYRLVNNDFVQVKKMTLLK